MKLPLRALLPFALVSLTLTGLPAQQKEKYEGEIRESDRRVSEIRASMEQGTTPPRSLRLRFRGERLWIYLAFYDLEGHEVWYHYREDRFDDRKKDLLRNLVKGAAYEVQGEYTGLFRNDRVVLPGDAPYTDALKERDSILVYEFQSSLPLRLEQILY